jgi:hypothetical protein
VAEEEFQGAKNLIKEPFLDEVLIFFKSLRLGEKRKL